MQMEKLKIKDIQRIYKVSRSTVYNWIQLGMPFEKIGYMVRFDKNEVENWYNNKIQK